MFTDTMNGKELMNEYFADILEIHDRIKRFDASEYLTECLRKKRQQQRVVFTRLMTTARNNRYLEVYSYERNGSSKQLKWNWNSYHAGLMNTEKGLMVLLFYVEAGMAVKYTPHFFKRYKKRLSKVCDWKTRLKLDACDSQEKTASLFVQRNSGTAWVQTKAVYKDKVHIFAPVPDGATLLQWDESREVMQANTFITYDMLSQKQIEMMKRLMEHGHLDNEEDGDIGQILSTED